MNLYDDGTMDVEVDGRTERRPYSVNTCRGRFNCAGEYRLSPAAYEPETRDDEIAVHTIGGPTYIVRTRP